MSSRAAPAVEAAIHYAESFSREHRFFYLDTEMICMGILTSTSVLDLSDADKQAMQEKLATFVHQREKAKYLRAKYFTLPLTMAAEAMINNAAAYANDLGDKHLLPEHIILSVLSTQNYVDMLLGQQGITLKTFRAALGQQRNKTLPDTIHRPKLAPLHHPPYTPLRLFLYGRKGRERRAEEHLYRARASFQYYDWEGCRKECELALQLQPNLALALIFIAATWEQEDNYAKAMEYALLALEQEPENTQAMNHIGYYYMQQRQNTMAEQWFKKILTITPEDVWTLNNLGFLYIEMGRYEDSLPYFDRIIALDPSFAFAYNNKGYAMLELGDVAQARALMLHSLELNSGNAYNYYNLGRLYLKEQDIPNAKAMLQKARQYNFAGQYGPEVDQLLSQLEDQ